MIDLEDELIIKLTEEETFNLDLDNDVIETGTNNYRKLIHKPSINSVELIENVTLDELGIQASEEGKGLSTNDYTDAEKTKLNGIEAGAEVNEIDSISVNGSTQTIDANKNVDITVPTNNNQLANGAGYITKNVNNLVNYTTTTNMNKAIDDAVEIETTNRENADNDLQEQIDAITVSSDVVDVVGTYSELENYDTTHIKANDIIKVLQDSTHNNALSYYRWTVINNVGSWVYIGSEGPFYTKSETDDLLNEKGTYTKPTNGIPKTDLDNSVQTSLGKADTSIQPTDIDQSYNGSSANAQSGVAIDGAGFLKNKGNITSSTNLSKLATGIYIIDSTTHSGFPTNDAYYGVLIQYGGDYKPQLLIAGIAGECEMYYRRYLVGSSAYTSWSKVAQKVSDLNNDSGFITGISSSDVTTALGYTPYNSTNPSGYQTASDVSTTLGNETKWAWYGTCSTGASTQAKVVTCAGFKLSTGSTIFVKFTNGQTYNGAPTLNVNGTGAITVQYKGGTSGIRYMWSAGEVVGFVYDGTYWIAIEKALATSTYYGVTKLVTSGTSSSDTTSLTPSALYNIMNNIVAGLSVYSSSSTYSVGDRVRYGTSWYECNTDISTAESWDANHWTKIDNLLTLTDSKVNKTSFNYNDSSETLTITIS